MNLSVDKELFSETQCKKIHLRKNKIVLNYCW